MRPLFTIHAGEYLAGLHIQKQLRLNAWIPAEDVGVDLLVTDRENRRAVSLQVKYGKDFLPEMPVDLRDRLRCLSWFTLNRAKLAASPAEFWVFVLRGFQSKESDFLVVPTAELRQRMGEIHGRKGVTLHSYFCTTKRNRAWESRGLGAADMLGIAAGAYQNPVRNFTGYLNRAGWAAVERKLRTPP